LGYTVRHTIETDVDSFWKLFLDQNVALAMWQDLGSPGSYEVVEEQVSDVGTRWRIDYTAQVELPSFAKKFVGDGSYSEFGDYDSVRKQYSARCVPKQNADKFGTTFEISTRPLGDGTRCERVTVVENTVKVYGVGGLIEKFLERTQRDAHNRAADFLNRWIRTHGVAASGLPHRS
jgi:hypothetical protein